MADTFSDTCRFLMEIQSKLNFAAAVNICRAYLKSGDDESEMMLLIQRHLTPLRSDRTYPLNLRSKRNRLAPGFAICAFGSIATYYSKNTVQKLSQIQ